MPGSMRKLGLYLGLVEDDEDARALSAGMSGDLEQAVSCGSTSVRVGTALLGPRPPALR